MKVTIVALSLMGGLLVAANASADEKSVYVLPTQTVYGHPQRPAAAVEVSRVRMTLQATTPTLAAGMKIEHASKKEPF